MNVSQLVGKSMPHAPSRVSLANVTKGIQQVPIKMIGYGTDGVGKSTFASGAPNPLFLTFDDRTGHLDVNRVKPATWDEMMDWLRLLKNEKHDYKTVVVDPVTWLEPLCHLKVTGDPMVPISKFDGGYGRGADAALEYWRQFVHALEEVWRNGMNVVLLAHCQVKKFEDPNGPGYDRYEIAMSPRTAGLLKQWSDFVIFMKHEAVAKITDQKTKKMRGEATGRHVGYTRWTAAYDAKFSGSAPAEIPLSWESFAGAVQASRAAKEGILARIDAMLAEIGDETISKKAREFVAEAGNNTARLEEVSNALVMKLEEKRSEGESK